ncbi:hypothetical protein Hypma_002384 [Hypsizygus marmoreus]|uniref:MYND-type domain-containing protein n=1 Tax=Hypsizygus marmoreus TaxID=39966 RepID=A0A369JD12_HYPMA|nr:hypothetical protein Hypma_002384 [Hypsizygus marmoreus]
MAEMMPLAQARILVKKVNAHDIHKERAEKAYKEKRLEEAEGHFLAAVNALIGPLDFEIPLGHSRTNGAVRWQPYIDMDPRVKACLMGCYVGLAMCSVLKAETEQGLAWFEEVRVLNINTRFALEDPLFDWIRWHIDLPELTYQRVKSLVLSSDIFRLLGNTGTAVDRRENTAHLTLDRKHQELLKDILDAKKLFELVGLRHPDPALTPTLKVVFPGLQVYGSWKKLSLKKNGGMKARLGFTSFIYKGHLYVAGGGGETKGPWFRDIWRLNLETLDAWQPLQPYLTPERYTGVWLQWNMKVYKDKAWLFTGRPQLDYFDLEKQKWGTVMSTYQTTKADTDAGVTNNWPYPVWNSQGSTQQVVGNKLYTFGGTHGLTLLGCNMFMELDFDSLKWRRLSGTVHLKSDFTCPGPRNAASSWVDRDQERIYVIFGECDRTAADRHNEPQGAANGYAYEDFWSWDIKAEKWRMERLEGNIPCPRSEAACAYNDKLGKTIVFGGYNPALMTKTERGIFPFTYYGDTFIFCPPESDADEPKWKQVLTRGFPTYRAQSQLICDPDTGKTYLFGGYVNTDSVPSRKDYISRTFGDLWQLRIDLPGGYFDDVDLEDEAKTAMIGPWQRCFTCGSAGRWKKCGGSCHGRAFFCDSQCLKEGWKDHKKMHDCKKVA